jgi:hypothetical protein
VGTGSSQLTDIYDSNGTLAERKTQTTVTDSDVDLLADRPSYTTVSSSQDTTALEADGHATATTVTYAGSSSPAGSWGTPL